MFAIKSPQNYHHQPGLCARVGELLHKHATDIAIITSPQAWKAVNPQLENSLRDAGIVWQTNFLTTECTDAAIMTHLASVRRQNATLVLGIGGGRVLDCSKAIASQLADVTLVTLPTVAATCAAWSPISIIYNEHGGHVRSQSLSLMPLMVLVDSEVIAHSDARYLRAGIVDALAKWYEFRPYQQKSDDSLALNLKVQAARLAVDIFEKYGEQAVRDNERQEVTPALIKTIDANIAIAGMANSMRDENPAPGVAHAIHNRLTHQPELHGWLHGEKVGFGLLVQSLLESRDGQPEAELLALLRRYGAPLALPDIGGSRAETLAVIAREVKFPAKAALNLPFSIAAVDLEHALLTIEKATF
ncbi:iron-containing alcohol dehydrogenase family protein [Serratia ficaria]|uniref:iron-containing alcohol dehydrogenase family protein n=1 Tax=Serratia ficaria TaxID=61651 RepID=UPI00217B2D0A|nr:iron-containing alcohol dehydrogenase family protein [Serratia ficaria]CAI1217671.1 Glycerol dehydrogenase [Serratia ficaria]CAI1217684.1 Glycerol dehydrogenase [Serratia ficaria]CAI2018465.1 Glycerol dehydrogenase [Serratia ficaria]CAI2531130.1 Glycerol dehydrogenase [Serratia ficaria]CAI2531874.1 Glycerol dehydrogenase [Serratia ficaria]